jgi:ubiquinone/menaquinone biosynthesis C-methylase UbiE
MTTDPRTYYDRFSASYERRRGHGYHALIDELESSMVPAGPATRLLEAGCGTGLVLERLRSHGAELFGIDLSAGMLVLARQRGHRVAHASITHLPFADGSFDVACSFKVLAHVPDIEAAIRELARVVRPGGTLVLEFYNRQSLRGLRWRLKRLFGGQRTAAEQREGELYTRYDALARMISYLPSNVSIVAVKGAIVFAPAAMVFQIPGLRRMLMALERWASGSALARHAGFVVLVLRRL